MVSAQNKVFKNVVKNRFVRKAFNMVKNYTLKTLPNAKNARQKSTLFHPG
jgi:hypothetical protein